MRYVLKSPRVLIGVNVSCAAIGSTVSRVAIPFSNTPDHRQSRREIAFKPLRIRSSKESREYLSSDSSSRVSRQESRAIAIIVILISAMRFSVPPEPKSFRAEGVAPKQ